MSEQRETTPSEKERGRIAAARARMERARATAIAARTQYRSVNLAFELSRRDLMTGGPVLAGAVAFRLFLWFLPASLVVVGALGFNPGDAQSEARSLGIGKTAAATVGAAALQSHHARWVLVVSGLALLVTVSHTLAVTVHTAVALTWGEQVSKPRGYVRVTAIAAGIMSGVVALVAFTSWLRQNSPGIGLAAIIVNLLIWAAIWWGISTLLPHPALPWWGLLPGAAFFGVGMEIMHLLTVLYLEPRVSSASALYGALGTAATLLLGAYFLARIMLASVALNATVATRLGDWRADRWKQIGT